MARSNCTHCFLRVRAPKSCSSTAGIDGSIDWKQLSAWQRLNGSERAALTAIVPDGQESTCARSADALHESESSNHACRRVRYPFSRGRRASVWLEAPSCAVILGRCGAISSVHCKPFVRARGYAWTALVPSIPHTADAGHAVRRFCGARTGPLRCCAAFSKAC